MPLPFPTRVTTKNFEIYQGDTVSLVFDVVIDNLPVDVSDAGVAIEINFAAQRGKISESNPSLFSATKASGIAVSGVDNNRVTVTIPPATSAGFDPGRVHYDLQFTEGAQIVTYFTGTVNTTQEIT